MPKLSLKCQESLNLSMAMKDCSVLFSYERNYFKQKLENFEKKIENLMFFGYLT